MRSRSWAGIQLNPLSPSLATEHGSTHTICVRSCTRRDPQLQRALLAYATHAEGTPVHMSLVMKAISNWVAKRIRSKEER